MKRVEEYNVENSSYLKIEKKESDGNITKSSVNIMKKKETFYSSVSLINEDNIVALSQNENKKCSNINKKALFLSGLVGIGTGFAMMPIFNREVRELEEYGINIHQYQAAYIVSTLNTLLFMSASSIVTCYKYLTSENAASDNLTKLQSYGMGALAVGSAILPLSQLWDIELHDKKIADSKGFDQFIAYAMITTIPLLIFKIIESYDSLHQSLIKTKSDFVLETIGSKLVTYSTCLLSAVARGISYASATKQLCKEIGLDNTASETIGIIIGGVIGSACSAISEYPAMKNLFKKQESPLLTKEMLIGLVAAIEGSWFALPSVSEGLTATQNWNILLRTATFSPLFISRTVYESQNLYKALTSEKAETALSLEV